MSFNSNEVAQNRTSIGTAIQGCTAYCLDKDLNEVKDNEEGELVIGGVQIMKEYLSRQDLTNKALISFNGETCYKTGDIAFRDRSGQFFVSGRIDDTIKVSGQRINLSDIDGYIEQVSFVQESATIAIPNDVTDMELISYVILTNKSKTKKELKIELKKILLTFQLPKKIIIKEVLPLNNSGKVCKKSLLNEYLS